MKGRQAPIKAVRVEIIHARKLELICALARERNPRRHSSHYGIEVVDVDRPWRPHREIMMRFDRARGAAAEVAHEQDAHRTVFVASRRFALAPEADFEIKPDASGHLPSPLAA
jgi:hypothetical protein